MTDSSASRWQKTLKSYEGLTLEQRANTWVVGGDTGLSSRAVWAAMRGVRTQHDNPHDPADLGRILRLLEIIPEWKPRVHELATLSNEWKALVERWDEIAATMEDEVGIAWEKAGRAPRTYALMQTVLDSAKRTR